MGRLIPHVCVCILPTSAISDCCSLFRFTALFYSIIVTPCLLTSPPFFIPCPCFFSSRTPYAPYDFPLLVDLPPLDFPLTSTSSSAMARLLARVYGRERAPSVLKRSVCCRKDLNRQKEFDIAEVESDRPCMFSPSPPSFGHPSWSLRVGLLSLVYFLFPSFIPVCSCLL